MPDYIDFHTHLDWYDDSVFYQLQDFQGVIVAASVNRKSYIKNIEIADKAKALGYSCEIIPTVGVHPKDVLEAIEDLDSYKSFLDKSPLIGEIGMDFCWYKNATPYQQEKVFRFFLQHCEDTGKYCVIHTKDAEPEIARILEDYPNAKPIIHWYDGPEDIYQEFCRRGYYQTFGCETSRSKHIQKLLLQTPKELILAETDNPTAEPWLGGSDDSINLIKRIYEDIGKVLNLNDGEVNSLINQNGTRIISSLKK